MPKTETPWTAESSSFSPHAFDTVAIRLGAAMLIGLLLGGYVVCLPYLPLPSDWQKMLLVVPVAVVVVILFQDLEKLLLFSLAIAIPLNLDFSVLISPYARNTEHLAMGTRTLIGTTELRVSLIFLLVAVGYALWLIRPHRAERKPLQFFGKTTIPALGLLFFSLLSGIAAPDRQLWAFRVAQLIEAFLVYFYLANQLHSLRELRFFLSVSLGAMLAEASLMLVQWVTGWSFQIAGIEAALLEPGRVGGTFGNTGPAAGYLSAMAILACAMIWGFSRRREKWMAAVCAIAGTLALVSTGSRAGWLGFGVTFATFLALGFTFRWVRRETLILLALGIIGIGALFSGTIYSRIMTEDQSSVNSRPMMWKLAWKVIQAHPWLGVGAGNYPLITREYFTFDVGDPNEVFDKVVHNAYLGIWAESGTFALLSYLGLLGMAAWQGWRCAWRRVRFEALLGIGVSLALVSLGIQMITGTFHTRAITLFVWVLCALSASLYSLSRTDTSDVTL